MAQDLHVGRASPTFVVEGNPDTFVGIIERHGIFARILRARKCPCAGDTGTPSMYCDLCNGDGFIYDFQRKLLQADEDSDIRSERNVVYPFRVPVLEPIRVERMLPPEQGGILEYQITGFNQSQIFINGNPLPYHWNKMRVSYYFDRYNRVDNEVAQVDTNTKTLTLSGPVVDDEYRSSNVKRAAGDIVIVERVYDDETGYEYTDYTFRKQQIYLAPGSPEPTPGKTYVTYYYCPAVGVLVNDLENREVKEKWITQMLSGTVRMSFDSWFDVGDGDLITLLVPEFPKEEILVHAGNGIDKLFEFDIASIEDEIFDQHGRKYREGTDYVLRNYRDLVWIGAQPGPGDKINVRYLYHPTYVVFMDGVMPNTLENKQYPKTVNARIWGKTLHKDLETLGAPTYAS